MSYQKCLSEFKSIDIQEMRKPGFLEQVHQVGKDLLDRVDQKNGLKSRHECPICNCGSSTKEFSIFGVDIVCCQKCTVRYTTKVPVNTDDMYSDEQHLSTMIELYEKNDSYRKERFGKERLDLIRRYIDEKPKRLFDIGCGTGWFLDVAKECGFEVYGQELGKELSAWTSNKLNIEVFNTPVDEIPESLKVDVITMFDLLEHVIDPVQFILDCKKHLNDDGIILIFVPHFDSLEVHIAKEHSAIVYPTAHLTYFTRKSIQAMSERTGLSLAYFKTCGIDLGDLKSYFEWKGQDGLAEACEKLYDYIQPVVDQAGAGNHLRCILQKT